MVNQPINNEQTPAYEPSQGSIPAFTPTAPTTSPLPFVALGTENQGFFLPNVDGLKTISASNPRFKAHLIVATVIASICFSVWLLVQFFTGQFPWFVFPVSTMAMTISIHYFTAINKNLFRLHIALYSSVMSMLVLIWFWYSFRSAWFLIPAFAWGIFLGVHACQIMFKESPERALYTHLTVFFLTCALVLECLSGDSTRVIVIVFFSLAISPCIHWSLHYYPGNRFVLHLLLFIDIQILLFSIWIISVSGGPGIPWFVFPFAAMFFCLLVHWRIHNRNQGLGTFVLPTTVSQIFVPAPVQQAGTQQESGLYPINIQSTQPFFYPPVNGVAPPPYPSQSQQQL